MEQRSWIQCVLYNVYLEINLRLNYYANVNYYGNKHTRPYKESSIGRC